MNIEIKNAVETNVEEIVELLHEFAAFENLSASCEITAEKLRTAMFAENAYVEALIVRNEQTAIGYAIFYPHFSSFRGQSGFYLEDIYLKTEFRGAGTGEKMLKAIAALGKSRGYSRIDFQVLEWNTPAVNFYKKLGAEIDETERHCKFTGAAFENLAN